MSMKRVLALCVAVFMASGTMSGCASTPAPTPVAEPVAEVSTAPAEEPVAAEETAAAEVPAEEPAAGASEPVELQVLNYIDMSASGATEELEVVWKAFDDAHPEIKVTRQDEFNDPYHNAIEAYAAAGALPDVLYAWPSGRSTTLHTQKLLKDLAPLIERDGLKDKYLPFTMDPAQQAGGYMAILPRGTTATHVFIANKEILDAAGLTPAQTYSELVAQVPVLREAGYDTVMMGNQDTWVMQSCLFSLVAGRFCGEGWEQKILSGEAKFTDPDFVAALNFIKQMYDDGVLSQATLALGYGDAPGQFSTGKAAYFIDGDWGIRNFITNATTGEALITPERQENFDIYVFPEIDLPEVKFNRSNTTVLATGWGIDASLADGSPELEAAWTLVKWLTGEETQSFLVRTGATPSPSWVGIDYASLPMEPLQVKLAGISEFSDVATVVVDGVFQAPVHTPINDGLQAIGMGTQTPEQVAEITQSAFEAWDAAN